MPKLIVGILLISFILIFCISCEKKIGNEIILVDSVEIKGLHYITTQDILRDCSISHKNKIAVDVGKLRSIINENLLIKDSKLIFNQDKLFVDITEKQALAGIGVLKENRIISGLLLDNMAMIAGYYKLDVPMILSDENFFRRKGYESDLNNIAGLLRRVKKYLPQIYGQISTIKPLMDNKVEVTLIGRNTKFKLDVNEENFDKLRLIVGYLDTRKYSPSKVDVYGDRAVIR
jgi:hypothetical protein